MKIVTYICVDEESDDNETFIPQLGTIESDQRNIIYWKCVMVFFCTSIRCNSHMMHVLYTNDRSSIIIEGVNIVRKLIDLGVEIRYLPFRDFKPPHGSSRIFKNAFYKFEVIKALGKNDDSYSILLDSDCVWTKSENQLFEAIKSDKILILDVHKRADPFLKVPDNLSMRDMGELYQQIEPGYPNLNPIRFGGEIIAGSSRNLNTIAENLESTFKYVVKESARHTFKFANGKTIFDGNEFLSSFVYNKNLLEWDDASRFIRRIWTTNKYNNVKLSDLDIAIWHLPAEKRAGLSLLFDEAVNPRSSFWRVPLDDFGKYLGGYVGIPRRKHKVKKAYRKIKGLIQKLVVPSR